MHNLQSVLSDSTQLINKVKFIKGLDDWLKSELQNNPDNSQNILKAYNEIQSSYKNNTEILDLSDLSLTSIPKRINYLSGLKKLFLPLNQLESLPIEIGDLKKLQILDLSFNNLKQISNKIVNLVELEELNLSSNKLSSLPDLFANLANLRKLDLSNNRISEFPDRICYLKKLQYLFLFNNSLISISGNINHLSNLLVLDLSNNQIAELPYQISFLYLLKKLNLSSNKITTIPESIEYLSNLESINLSNNLLARISPEFFKLLKLQDIDLADNYLTEIPKEIFKLRKLKKLDLYRNQLMQLPFQEILGLTSLKWLNISRNILNENPRSIFISSADLEILDYENPYLQYSFFFKILLMNALINENEKSSYHEMPDEDFVICEESIGSVFYSSTQEETYSSKISDIYQYLMSFTSLSTLPRNYELIINFIQSIEQFTTRSPIWIDANRQQRKFMSREMLIILSQIYERQNDYEFLGRLNQIISDELFNSRELKIMTIFNLRFLITKKANDELLNLHPMKIFDYLKHQLFFYRIIDFAQDRVDAIRSRNYRFSNDIEIFLNFIRIFNSNFIENSSLKLPNISYQNLSSDPLFSPSKSSLDEFDNALDEVKKDNNRPLCLLMAQQIANEIYDRKGINLPEISAIKFITKIKENIDKVGSDKLAEYFNFKSDNHQQIKNILSCQKKTLVFFLEIQLCLISKNKPILNFRNSELEQVFNNFFEKFLPKTELEISKKLKIRNL